MKTIKLAAYRLYAFAFPKSRIAVSLRTTEKMLRVLKAYGKAISEGTQS